MLTYRIGVLAAYHADLRSRTSAEVVVLRHEGYHDAGTALTQAMGLSVFGKFNTYLILRTRARVYEGGDGGARRELRHIRNR